MKAQFSLSLAILSFALGSLHAHDSYSSSYSNTKMSGTEQYQQNYRDIHTKELRDLLRSNPSVIVVDTRTPEYATDKRIAGAKFIPYDSRDDIILGNLPNKRSIIVVYCNDADCSASRFLSERLTKMGYQNVLRYVEGIEGWKQANNPVENPKASTLNTNASYAPSQY